MVKRRMKVNNDKYNILINNAKVVFVDELTKKLDELIKILNKDSTEFTYVKIKEASRFFHSLNGTAGTLGFNELAEIGKITEENLKLFTEKRESIDKVIKGDIEKSIYRVKNQMSFIRDENLEKSTLRIIENELTYDSGKILLIDDDIVTLKLLESTFTSEGYTVYVCDDSVSAMDIIETSKPDIILLDIMMPKCDGYELLEKIRANSKYSDISIAFISAMDSMNDKLKGLKAGVDDYITKPFAIEEIVLRVEMILRRANKFKEKLRRDTLTGAYSRYCLNEKIGSAFEEFKIDKSIFSIAFLDIDLFKKINDNYGHNTGDFILTEFAAYLCKNLRNSDYVFRYGGEEFIILFENTDEKQAFEVIERIREKFSRESFDYNNKQINITFSAGIVQVNDCIMNVQQLLKLADEAMYLSKKSGRNKVTSVSNLDGALSRQKTVLLVDDENTLLKLLNIKLSEVGYNVRVAENGHSALEAIDALQPDVIILDRALPDIDGLEICREVKKNPNTKSIPIIILSQKKSEEEILEGLKCGADDYVTKPFSINELEDRISKVLRN